MDSVCLLKVLSSVARAARFFAASTNALAARPGPPRFHLQVLHCDHHTRPGQGPGTNAHDSALVAQMCLELGVECEFAIASEGFSGNFQAAARAWRYAEAERVRVRLASTLNAPVFVATGHHARDAVEGMLFNLTRGAGPQGLSGFASVDARRGFLRPFALVKHKDLLEYATMRGLNWSEDPSNAQNDYARNRLRQAVLPVLAEINPAYEAAFGRCAAGVRTLLSTFAQRQAAALLETAGSATPTSATPRRPSRGNVFFVALDGEGAGLTAETLAFACHAALREIQPGGDSLLMRDLGHEHWSNLLAHLEKARVNAPSPLSVPLPQGRSAWCFANGIAFGPSTTGGG